ncbi:MAG TPA: ABC transporter ATP-binding protein [Nitriliruptorales bacterium]
MSTLTVDRVSVDLLDARVLHDVSLTVESGSWVSLIGPNGAGKTTLLRAIAGAVVHAGGIELDGVAPARLRQRDRARTVAVVPQQPSRPEGMTVLHYVLLGRTPYVSYLGVESMADLAVTMELLDTLELRTLAPRPVRSLSGGEFQRAVLARALAQQAPLLLLDEPTTSLDLGHAQQVLELVDELRRERELTVVSALHDLTTAAQFSDRLVLLVAGQVVADGTAAEVLTEELILAHYGARVRIVASPEAAVVVVPLRARARLLAGGGP